MKGGLRGIFGWEINQPWMGSLASPQTFGKTGLTGCSELVDTEKGFGIVLLSNATYLHRKPLAEHRRLINAVRYGIAYIILKIDVDNMHH